MSKKWVPGILVGMGITLAAPVVLPVLACALRPLAKSAIKGGLVLGDKVKEITAEAREQMCDLVAEVKAECVASAAKADKPEQSPNQPQ